MTRLEKWGQAVRIALSIVTFIIAVLAFGFIQFSNGYDAGVKAAYDYLKQSSHSTQQSEGAWETDAYLSYPIHTRHFNIPTR